MHKNILIILLLLTLASCGDRNENLVDVSNISINFSIDRFDIDFYSSTNETLGLTQEKYPFFFSKIEHDSVWINKINNKEEKELFIETQKSFQNISFLEKELKTLFKHLKYYNSGFTAPKVITLLSNIDSQNKVIYTKDYLLISLDVYLGENHRFYADYPNYIKQNFNSSQIVVDVANAIVKSKVNQSNDRTFIGKMVKEGLRLYLLDLYLPNVKNAYKIGYSEEKYNWAVNNE